MPPVCFVCRSETPHPIRHPIEDHVRLHLPHPNSRIGRGKLYTSGVINSHSAMYATVRGATAIAIGLRQRASNEAWLEDRLRRSSICSLWEESLTNIGRSPRALLHTIHSEGRPISHLSRYRSCHQLFQRRLASRSRHAAIDRRGMRTVFSLVGALAGRVSFPFRFARSASESISTQASLVSS